MRLTLIPSASAENVFCATACIARPVIVLFKNVCRPSTMRPARQIMRDHRRIGVAKVQQAVGAGGKAENRLTHSTFLRRGGGFVKQFRTWHKTFNLSPKNA